MDSPELGLAAANFITFIGMIEWLVNATWKKSNTRVIFITICFFIQLLSLAIAFYNWNFLLILFSIALVCGYLWAAYYGIKHTKGSFNDVY